MKSIITAMLAAASFIGVASATDSYTFGTANQGSGVTSATFSLGDVDGTFAISGGSIWYGATATGSAWANSDALTKMNTELGTSVSTFSGIIASGNGGTGTLTLDFSNSETYSEGTSIVMYVAVGARDDALSNLTISGLDNMSVTYATNTGSGFSDTATYSATSASTNSNAVTLVRIEGTVTSSNVVLASTTAKSGVAYAAIATADEVAANVAAAAVPEPATATLSLLALAGLAARRRRK